MSLMALYAIQARWDEALKHADLIVRLHRDILDRKLPYVSECQQCKVVRYEGNNWLKSFQLPLLKPGHAGLAEASAEWVLNSKSSVMELLAERTRRTRDQKDAVVLMQLARLGQVREQLARAGHLSDADPDHVEELAKEEKKLTRMLGREVFREGRATAWVKLEDVRAAIPKGAVLLELLKISCDDLLTHKAKEDRYLAWVIPRKGEGEARFFDLGPSLEIEDAAKAAARLTAAVGKKDDERGEAHAEKPVRECLKTLRGLVLPAAVLKELEKKKLWLVSPDSALWMVPWQALPDARGEYAVMKHDVRLLTSGRDLAKAVPERATGPAVILGNPDFKSVPGRILARATDRVYERDAGNRGVPLRSSSLPESWGALSGTGAEVAAIRPQVGRLVGKAPLVYVGGEATETAFKALRRPRLVVFCTHGFYLPSPRAPGDAVAVPTGEAALRFVVPPGARVWVDGESKTERLVRIPLPPRRSQVFKRVRIETKTGAKHEKVYRLRDGKVERVAFEADASLAAAMPENPLIRCGLVLAGANNRHLLPKDAADDGILTGLEIVGTDLRGTELVVLSACETGAGEIRTSEGVAGLRQAFQLAGARRVVASLWRVPDSETASLMKRFWTSLAEGKDSAEALCAAQRAFIADRRKKEGGAHPHYWAAFSVTGR